MAAARTAMERREFLTGMLCVVRKGRGVTKEEEEDGGLVAGR